MSQVIDKQKYLKQAGIERTSSVLLHRTYLSYQIKMPYCLGKSLGLIGRGQEPLSFSLTGSPTLCTNTPYISDLNASRLLAPSDRTEADIRWTTHAEQACDPEDSFKEHAVLCLPCCHHTEDHHPGMDDTPLDGKARNALEEYSNSFDEYRLLKRRLSTLTHSPRSEKAA